MYQCKACLKTFVDELEYTQHYTLLLVSPTDNFHEICTKYEIDAQGEQELREAIVRHQKAYGRVI